MLIALITYLGWPWFVFFWLHYVLQYFVFGFIQTHETSCNLHYGMDEK